MLPFRTMVMAVAAAGLLSFFATAPLSAAPRVALVIGNASYAHASTLANPLNDAADMGAALERLGFAVTRLENGSDAEMRRGLNEFRRAASASEVAVVFYAGHGIEVDGRNFLVPVDARLATDQDVEYEAIPLELASRAVERASGLRLVILDACRENPFAVSMQRAGATRSIGRGLARVEPSGETLVAYAAKEGTVASDGEGRNSPYSEALLRFLEEPNLEVMFMLRKVRDAVLASTGGSQEPFWYGSLSSKGVYLAAGPEPEPSPVAQPPVAETPRLTATNHREDRYWDSVKDSADPADLKAYLERYPSGTYETLARNRLKRLQDKPADAKPPALDGASTSASDGMSVSGRLEAERLAAEREFWASVKGSDDPADIRAYLDQYPDGTYEVLARNRLKRIEGTASIAGNAEAEAKAHAETDATEQSAPVSSDTAVVSAPPQPASSALTLATPTPQEVESSLGLGRKERRLVQQGLASLGYAPGPVDGLFGARTRTAIGQWQASQGDSATGYLDAETTRTLSKAAETTPSDPAEVAYKVAERNNTIAAYQAVVDSFSGVYTALARQKIEELEAAALAGERGARRQALSATLGREFSPEAVDESGWTDMHYAAALDLPGLAEELVEMGVDVDVRLDSEEGSFGAEVTNTLRKFGQHVAWGRHGNTPLHIAASVNAVSAAKVLVENGANLHAKTRRRWTSYPYRLTPLHIAAYVNALSVAELLVENGASVHAKASDDTTPLHWAASENALSVAKVLVENGANVHATTGTSTVENEWGLTPLHMAASENALSVAEYLVENGASVRARNMFGSPPLFYAARNDSLDVAKFLVDQGAEVRGRNDHGRTPLHWATDAPLPQLVMQFLVDQGADMDAVDKNGETPRMWNK